MFTTPWNCASEKLELRLDVVFSFLFVFLFPTTLCEMFILTLKNLFFQSSVFSVLDLTLRSPSSFVCSPSGLDVPVILHQSVHHPVCFLSKLVTIVTSIFILGNQILGSSHYWSEVKVIVSSECLTISEGLQENKRPFNPTQWYLRFKSDLKPSVNSNEPDSKFNGTTDWFGSNCL